MRFILIAVLVLGVSLRAAGLSAPTLYVPPEVSAKAAQNQSALQARTAQWLENEFTIWVYSDFEGQNDRLRDEGSHSPLQVAEGLPIDRDAAYFFEDAIPEENHTVWLTAIQSTDAEALRIQVRLDDLKPGERLWLLDPAAPHVAGPFTAADAVEGGTWLPTTGGDTLVLALESTAPVLPALYVQQLSHYFIAPLDSSSLEKGSQCPIPIACETDPEILNAATGVGLLIIAVGSQQFLCTGSLLNNANTVEREPYLIGANHCFPGLSNAAAVEVIWDFQSSACSGGVAPALSSLPRSQGREFLAVNEALDAQFLELDQVPVGGRGRAWLGWESGAVSTGSAAISIHHPMGAPQELNRGVITRTSVSSFLGQNQVQVQWTEGITKNGSSGSPALLTEGGLRVFGMLSNGVDQSCSNTSPRLDQYASLREFFPQIQVFLTGQAGVPATGCAPAATPGASVREFLTVSGFMTALLLAAAWKKSRTFNA